MHERQKKLCHVLFFIAALIIFLVEMPVFAHHFSSTTYDIPNDVLAAAGASSVSTSYRLSDSLGQSSPIGPSSGITSQNHAGFWTPRDASISKTQEFDDRGDGRVSWGDTISYTLTIMNFFDTAIDLMIYDALSTFVSYETDSFTVNNEEKAPIIPAEGQLQYEFFGLDIGQSLTIAFDVTVKPEDLVPIGSWIENVAWVDVYIDEVKIIDAKLSNTVGVEVVPEPATVIFLGIGLLGLFALVRWRRKIRK